MALESLTYENWLDMREAVQLRLDQLHKMKPHTSYEKAERARRVNSLKESLDKIEEVCRMKNFEEDDLPF